MGPRPGGAPLPPAWLIVVQRNKPEVYGDLRTSFELDRRVNVILDRRRADRRRAVDRAEPERRRRERRQSPPALEMAFSREAGFFLITRR